MIAALLFGQASAEGVQFFQPAVGGFLSQGSMVPMAGNAMAVHPMAGNEMAFQPVIMMDVSEEGVSDNTYVRGVVRGVCVGGCGSVDEQAERAGEPAGACGGAGDAASRAGQRSGHWQCR